MLTRNLLCVTLTGAVGGVAEHLLAQGWRVAQATDLPAAVRMQAHQRFPVGLLVIGTPPAGSEVALEACIKASRGSEWVAVCDREALASPGFRDLLLNCFFDHQTLPLVWHDLELVLAHAAQRALLRSQQPSDVHAADSLGLVGQGPVITRLREQIRKVAAFLFGYMGPRRAAFRDL